jgi:ribose-phosphate pyrophosphokinase
MTLNKPLNNIKLIACHSNIPLVEKIGNILGISLTKFTSKHFQDKEIFVEINENVRGRDVFVLQSTSFPANDHLMELLITIDALKRASAHRITAVLPYYGYARQDRKTAARTPISAKLVADIITTAGADRVLTLDLHAAQIQGFFNIPTDNLFAAPVFALDIREKSAISDDLLIVSPDVGGVVRARNLAERLGVGIAIIDKRRPEAGKSEVMNIIGDVKGKKCILIDDMIDSGGTLCNAAKALCDEGASEVSAYITHGVLSNGAYQKIKDSVLSELVITDSIQATNDVLATKNIRILSIAPLMAEAIRRTALEESVSSLFK